MELGGSQAFPSMMEVFIQQAEIYVLVYAADDKVKYYLRVILFDKLSEYHGENFSYCIGLVYIFTGTWV